ncbi:OLC1v1021795C1 [Oldenlandia corymbosa var. corymbosa]|uniref:OLC1v1021795C1 n=1 Tax=Oldenlandia corymbosa var. corymbosa TaxID=529605 RepID=A0AAV1BWP1_OLDCO|nr:OLC1v1021795C1 [Oldenlandia corymbosa var. corymbosa]
MKKCELCNSAARMYCESDQASLCWDCDSRVHGANFLVAKHLRTLLCNSCQSPTPWTASGPKLGPTVSICQSCAAHGTVNRAVDHGRRHQDDDDHGNHEDDEDDDDDDDDEDSDDDDGSDEGDGDNQVVPLVGTNSPPSPPPLSSSSSSSNSEDSSTKRSSRRNGQSNSRFGFFY